MGVTGMFGLALYKLGMRPLEEREAEAVTNALLRNLKAWEITIDDPRTAAAVDLVGCVSGVVLIRVMEKLREIEETRRRSPVQVATAAREEKPPMEGRREVDPAPPPPAASRDDHTPEHDGAGITAALTS